MERHRDHPLSRRAYSQESIASSWEEIWEAGPYFQRIAELIEDAKEYVIFVGWQIDSRLPLERPLRPSETSFFSQRSFETLREKVIRICSERPLFHIYFLVWDHAYFYVLEREYWQGRVWEDIHPRVHFIFDNRHPFGSSHHEKICIIDGKTAFCGGIDFCDERWDSPHHFYFDPRRSLDRKTEKHGPYHDLSVQVTGPVCGVIQEYIEKRWRALSSIEFPKSRAFKVLEKNAVGHRVYISRTCAQIESWARRTGVVREIEFLFRELIHSAKTRIIIEGQYYWSEILNDILLAKIHEMKGKSFEVFLILAQLRSVKSLTRYMANHEMRLIRKLEEAAAYCGTKLMIGYPVVVSSATNKVIPPKPIYIHSKVLIVDDRYLSIGSANFATRALRIDTEMNLTFEAQNSFERRYVSKVAENILDHWKVRLVKQNTKSPSQPKSEPTSDITLIQLRSKMELLRTKNFLCVPAWIPVVSLFDPVIPWFYRFKLKILRRFGKNSLAQFFFFLSIWFSSIVLTAVIAGGGSDLSVWSFLYCTALGSIWLWPVPFVFLMILAAIQLDPFAASQIGVAAIWVSSILGYSMIRMFPESAWRYYQKFHPNLKSSDLMKRLGNRKFSDVVFILLDPRVGIQVKIILQGISCVPLPWFLLGTGVLLPAILYTLCRWGVPVIFVGVPGWLLEEIKRNSVMIYFVSIQTPGFKPKEIISGVSGKKNEDRSSKIKGGVL